MELEKGMTSFGSEVAFEKSAAKEIIQNDDGSVTHVYENDQGEERRITHCKNMELQCVSTKDIITFRYIGTPDGEDLKFEGNYYVEENKDGVKIIETLEWRSDDLMPEYKWGRTLKIISIIAFIAFAFVYFWPYITGVIGV